jgi:hypothetical protein
LLFVLTGRESIAFSISGTQTGSELSFTPKDAFGQEIPVTGTVKTYDLSPLPPLDVTTSNDFISMQRMTSLNLLSTSHGVIAAGTLTISSQGRISFGSSINPHSAGC